MLVLVLVLVVLLLLFQSDDESIEDWYAHPINWAFCIYLYILLEFFDNSPVHTFHVHCCSSYFPLKWQQHLAIWGNLHFGQNP